MKKRGLDSTTTARDILPSGMSEPEYVICLNCETPTYSFDWDDGKVTAAICGTCGNDEAVDFVTETEFEEMQQ